MLTIALRRGSERAALRAAVRVLKRGGVVAFPTETSYGLGCDPRNARAVKQIFKIKGRDEGKPLQLIAGSLAQVSRLAPLDGPAGRLGRRYWPGPLTLLVSLRRGIRLAPNVSPHRMIGIRVSSSAFTRKLALAFGHPIAATSANRSGNTPAFSGRGVQQAFLGHAVRPDLLLNSGSIPRRKPSTVARVRPDRTIEVLRQGSIRLPST